MLRALRRGALLSMLRSMGMAVPPTIVALLFLALSVSSAWAQGDIPDDRPARMHEYLAAAAALGQFSGSVLVAEEGRVLVDTAFGLANIELGVPNAPETRFRVASITKPFTAMAIMMLAEEGKLSIADTISMWVDSLPPAWSGITIHQMLRHTSGIPDYEEWFDGYDTQAYSDYMSQAHAPARIIRDARLKPLDHAPGTQFRYSNTAYILLGYIIERASGMPYEEFLRQRIHDPLDMSASLQDRSELLITRRAQGYRLREGAFPISFFNGLQREDYRNAVYQLMQPPQADAGLITTARDLYRWDQALYSERLLSRTSLDSIFTAGEHGYGYGWFIVDGENGRTHEHSGGLPGFSAYIMRVPETQRTVIVLQNIERSVAIEQDLAAILRGVPVPTPRARQLIPGDSARDAALVGTYRTSTGDSVHVFVQNGTLGVQQPGGVRMPIFPEVGGAYFSPRDGSEVDFVETDGRITLTIRDAFGDIRLSAERQVPAPGAALRISPVRGMASRGSPR